MEANYWQKVLERRFSRRRALVAGGAGVAVLGSAILTGCGSDGGGGKEGGKASSLLNTPSDTTAKAVRGGTMYLARPGNPGDFDPLAGRGASTSNHTIAVYSTLLKHKIGKYPNGPDGSLEADAASSWEIAPDGLQITLKLKGLPFDSRPPTSGRKMNSGDVKFSWEKFEAKAGLRGEIANKISADSPVVGVETPDPQTAVFKLAFPYPTVDEILAWPHFVEIEPVELESGFDARTDMRGSGPWIMEEYVPSAYMRMKRNPQWYEKDRPYLDAIEQVVIPEYAAGIAQFRTGKLWNYLVRQEDIIPTKTDEPELNLFQKKSFSGTKVIFIGLGYKQGSPFFDERIRQAMSMLMDRALFQQTFFNLDNFASQGLDVKDRWNVHVPTSWPTYLDPRDEKTFGENAKYYKYNPEEAKKLMQAATGNKLPLEIQWPISSIGDPNQNQVLIGMMEAHGDFKVKAEVVDYQGVFRPISNGNGTNVDGAYLGNDREGANFDLYMFANYHHKGSKIKWPFTDDFLEQNFVLKHRAERDPQKRGQLQQDLVRYMASKMYTIPYSGEALSFDLAWPFAGNWGVYTSWATDFNCAWTYNWFDQSKKKA